MKKNRNAFFSENSMNYQNYNNMMQPPFQAGASNSYAYSGNIPFNNMEDYQERFAKIERQINRLDKRVSKLETYLTKNTDDIDNTSNNMYMI